MTAYTVLAKKDKHVRFGGGCDRRIVALCGDDTFDIELKENEMFYDSWSELLYSPAGTTFEISHAVFEKGAYLILNNNEDYAGE